MRRAQIDNTFLLGLAYFCEGIPFTLCLPTIKAAIEGGYGAGERLIDMAVISIYELLGMLTDIPADVQ